MLIQNKRVILDAGHGGDEPGAVYGERQEKQDNLNLALAVGSLLAKEGVDVMYTRVDDICQTPYEKAEIGNRSGADYFISFHRNAMPVPESASGAQVLVYKNGGAAELLARNILDRLVSAGYSDLGIVERPGLIVLNSTEIPAVLIETGFIDNDADNKLFDENFDALANGIADGILSVLRGEETQPVYYQVQLGAYRNSDAAAQAREQLTLQGFPAFVVYQDGYYKVRVGAFLNIDNAVRMEQKLREYGYNTYMVRETAVY